MFYVYHTDIVKVFFTNMANVTFRTNTFRHIQNDKYISNLAKQKAINNSPCINIYPGCYEKHCTCIQSNKNTRSTNAYVPTYFATTQWKEMKQ